MAVREHATLMCPDMAIAVRQGIKRITRRVVRPQPVKIDRKNWEWVTRKAVWHWPGGFECCPYGLVGDRLRFLTTWAAPAKFDGVKPSLLPKSVKTWSYFDTDEKPKGFGRLRPGRFMPGWMRHRMPRAEIDAVRVERLHAITAEDVRAEGLTSWGVERTIASTARRFKTVPEYWIRGADQGLSYCRACAEKEIKALRKKNPKEDYLLDGGWGDSESDSQRFCERCRVALECLYTRYACEEELEHFAKNGFDSSAPDDCYSLERMLMSWGLDEPKLAPGLLRLGFQATWDRLNAKRGYAWKANPWVWVVSFKVEGKR